MKSYSIYSMKQPVDNTVEESIKLLREWAKEKNYSEEMTEKVIESLRLMMSGIKF